MNFNPHSHEGSDDILEDTDKGDEYFNPHSHEGSDLNSGTAETVTVDFNPHSHEGSDKAAATLLDMINFISIHTPTKGSTGYPVHFLCKN